MATELRTSKRPDGSGFAEVISSGEQVVRIHWRGEGGCAILTESKATAAEQIRIERAKPRPVSA